MDVLSLRSSSSSLMMSKPFGLTLTSKHQRAYSVKFGTVSCRSTITTTKENLYKVLCVSPESATLDEIKRAYRSMALQYHPDVCHDPSMKEKSTRMFVQVNAAYKTLSNPRLREQYDSVLGLRKSKVSVVSDHERWGSLNVSSDDERLESRFQEQVIELKTRSRRRMGHKGGSSGNRMRTRNRP